MHISQLEEDDQGRHDQPEEETYMSTFDVCALEGVEESKNDANKRTTSKIMKTPVTPLTPAIMLKQCEDIMARLKESAKQRNEASEQSGSSSLE